MSDDLESSFISIPVSYFQTFLIFLLIILYILLSSILLRKRGQIAVLKSQNSYVFFGIMYLTTLILFVYVLGSSDLNYLFIDRVALLRSSQHAPLFSYIVPLVIFLAIFGYVNFSVFGSKIFFLFSFVPVLFVFLIGFRAPLVNSLVACIFIYFTQSNLKLFSKHFIYALLFSVAIVLALVFYRLVQSGLDYKFISLINALATTEIAQISQNFIIGIPEPFECTGYNGYTVLFHQIPLVRDFFESDPRFSSCLNELYGSQVSAKSASNIYSEFFYTFSYGGLFCAAFFQFFFIKGFMKLIDGNKDMVSVSLYFFGVAWLSFYFYRSNFVLTLGTLKFILFMLILNFVFRQFVVLTHSRYIKK